MDNIHVAKFIYTAIILTVSACSSTPTVKITYRSLPEGAIITDWGGGKHFAMEPAKLTYDINNKNRCVYLRGVKAIWRSGATKTTDKYIKHCSGPGEYFITLTRPAHADGLEIDLSYAKKIKQRREIQELSRNLAELQRQIIQIRLNNQIQKLNNLNALREIEMTNRNIEMMRSIDMMNRNMDIMNMQNLGIAW